MGRRKTFFKNAVLLTVATLMLRVIGMAFRIVISNQLGAEGMGLYQVVLSVYMLASTLASAGLSLAVTRLVSEEQIRTHRAGMQKLMALCIAVAAVMGSVMALLLYAGAGLVAGYWVGVADAAGSLRVLALSLPFMAISAVLRGYFTARRQVGFTSLAQLLEQGVKFSVCMGLIALFGINSTTFGCLLVMAADTVSEWFSFAFQYIGYRRDLLRLPKTGRELPRTPSPGRRLFDIAAPVAGVRIISSALYTLENTLVPTLLAGYLAAGALSQTARSGALAKWGQLKGMGIPVLMFPSTLLAAFVLLLVPELSEFRARKNSVAAQQMVGLALHVTLAVGIGIAAGFYLLGGWVCEVLYPGQGIGFYVQVLAPLVPFMYLENVTEGMLKGLGEQKVTLYYSLINVAVRLVLIVLLVPRWGMAGFLWMMLVDNVVTSLLHANRVLQVLQMQLDWGHWVLRPLAAAAVVYGGGVLALRQLTGMGFSALWLLLIIGCGMAAGYLVLLLIFGSFTRAQLQVILGQKRKTAAKD